MRLTPLFHLLAVVALSVLVAGCPDETTTTPPTCPAGEENCACDTGDTCRDGLTCTGGFCVPEAVCNEGSDGCPCYSNGTCDTGLTCNASTVCEPETATPGGLGDPCDASTPCGTDNGTQLECTDGTCQLPVTCTPGTLNCPCNAGDTCDGNLVCTGGTCTDPACTTGTLNCPCGAGDTCDTGLTCENSVCVTPTCTAGTLNCPCDTGDVCDTGLTCESGTCVTATVTGDGVKVSAADVRACTVVLDLADVTVTFADAVIGRSKRMGTRLAFSFAAKADASLADVVATILGSDGQPADMSAVTPTKIECFDRLGAAVATPGLTLQ